MGVSLLRVQLCGFKAAAIRKPTILWGSPEKKTPKSGVPLWRGWAPLKCRSCQFVFSWRSVSVFRSIVHVWLILFEARLGTPLGWFYSKVWLWGTTSGSIAALRVPTTIRDNIVRRSALLIGPLFPSHVYRVNWEFHPGASRDTRHTVRSTRCLHCAFLSPRDSDLIALPLASCRLSLLMLNITSGPFRRIGL